MGKVLKVLGIVFLAIIVLVIGLLVWSHQKGKGVQEDFFTAVLSGDPSQVLEKFHPKLREQVDEPVLAVWMAAVKEQLGAFEGLDASDFSTKASATVGGSQVESEGTVKFAKGTARSSLKLIDGKITAFNVTSDVFEGNWLKSLEDSSLYRARAESFLTTLFQGDVDAALGKMHESLRSKFEPESFGQAIGRMREGLGPIDAFEFLDETFEPGPPQALDLRYRVKGANDSMVGRIRFGFEGMKGHLVAIKIPE